MWKTQKCNLQQKRKSTSAWDSKSVYSCYKSCSQHHDRGFLYNYCLKYNVSIWNDSLEVTKIILFYAAPQSSSLIETLTPLPPTLQYQQFNGLISVRLNLCDVMWKGGGGVYLTFCDRRGREVKKNLPNSHDTIYGRPLNAPVSCTGAEPNSCLFESPSTLGF